MDRRTLVVLITYCQKYLWLSVLDNKVNKHLPTATWVVTTAVWGCRHSSTFTYHRSLNNQKQMVTQSTITSTSSAANDEEDDDNDADTHGVNACKLDSVSNLHWMNKYINIRIIQHVLFICTDADEAAVSRQTTQYCITMHCSEWQTVYMTPTFSQSQMC